MENMLTIDGKKNIKAALILAGVSQSDIARALNVSRSIVSGVISGDKTSARVRRAIARALGVKANQIIWPRKAA